MQTFSLRATGVIDAAMNGCQEEKVRFLQSVPNARMLFGKNHGGKSKDNVKA